MYSNLYLFISRDLFGTGLFGVAFIGILGLLLILDARGVANANQRNR